MTRYTVNRFEPGRWAVLEDDTQRQVTLPSAWLPGAVRTGDVLIVRHEEQGDVATVRFELDPARRRTKLIRPRVRGARSSGTEDDVMV